MFLCVITVRVKAVVQKGLLAKPKDNRKYRIFVFRVQAGLRLAESLVLNTGQSQLLLFFRLWLPLVRPKVQTAAEWRIVWLAGVLSTIYFSDVYFHTKEQLLISLYRPQNPQSTLWNRVVILRTFSPNKNFLRPFGLVGCISSQVRWSKATNTKCQKIVRKAMCPTLNSLFPEVATFWGSPWHDCWRRKSLLEPLT